MGQRLNDMLPSFPVNDVENKPLADFEQPREHVQRNDSGSVHGANLNHLLFRKLGLSMKFSFWLKRPSLQNHVCHVLFVSRGKQVIWIAAISPVAFMAAFHSFWDWAVGVFPSKSVCVLCRWLRSFGSRSSGVFSKSAISFWAFGSKPQPAFFWIADLNFSPESDRWVCFGYH